MDILLKRCLDDLEARIDEAQEEAYRAQWAAFLEGALTEGFFTPPSRRPAPASVAWPDIHINDALDDIDLMVWRELKGVSDILARGGNQALNVRCNYGVGIMASQYGCPIVQMDRAGAICRRRCRWGARRSAGCWTRACLRGARGWGRRFSIRANGSWRSSRRIPRSAGG